MKKIISLIIVLSMLFAIVSCAGMGTFGANSTNGANSTDSIKNTDGTNGTNDTNNTDNIVYEISVEEVYSNLKNAGCEFIHEVKEASECGDIQKDLGLHWMKGNLTFVASGSFDAESEWGINGVWVYGFDTASDGEYFEQYIGKNSSTKLGNGVLVMVKATRPDLEESIFDIAFSGSTVTDSSDSIENTKPIENAVSMEDAKRCIEEAGYIIDAYEAIDDWNEFKTDSFLYWIKGKITFIISAYDTEIWGAPDIVVYGYENATDGEYLERFLDFESNHAKSGNGILIYTQHPGLADTIYNSIIEN